MSQNVMRNIDFPVFFLKSREAKVTENIPNQTNNHTKYSLSTTVLGIFRNKIEEILWKIRKKYFIS